MRIRYFFYIAILIYIFGEIGHSHYLKRVDLFEISKIENILLTAFGIIRDISLTLCLSGATIYSFWSYQDTSNKSRAKLLIVGCILLNVVFVLTASYSYKIGHQNFQKAIVILEGSRFSDSEFLEKYQKKISSNDMKLNEKIKYSEIVASIIYKDTGNKINVVNEQNEVVQYEPTAEDVELYSQTRKTISIMENTIQSLKFAAIFWMSVLILSVIIGFLVLKRRINKEKLDPN